MPIQGLNPVTLLEGDPQPAQLGLRSHGGLILSGISHNWAVYQEASSNVAAKYEKLAKLIMF